MADNFKFDLVSPERLLVSGEVTQVVVPGSEGDFAVLAGHAPVLSTMRPGMLEIDDVDKKRTRYFVAGGFAEATPERLTVLAEEAVAEADLDANVLAQSIKNAQEDFDDARDDEARNRAQETLDHLKQIRDAL